MLIGLELKKLCEEFIGTLYLLKEKGLITEDELEKCLETKVKFVETFQEKVEMG